MSPPMLPLARLPSSTFQMRIKRMGLLHQKCHANIPDGSPCLTVGLPTPK